MPENPRGLSHFWREVKRRNVHRSLAIYAGTAFIILEACSLIFPRWGLPDWSIDLVLWLLILGAVINVFVAWFYDITPEGMQKTSLPEGTVDLEKQPTSRVWKMATYFSLVVIVVLILINLVGGPTQLRAGDIQSLVILPFDNFTGDEQLDYFVEGMHASLIGDMGQLGGLQVKSRTSASAFKDKDMTIPEIATELGTDAALETAVMCLGDTICLQFRLVSTTGDEEQLWVADYREEKSQILNLYNRITKQIAEEVMVELSADEERRLDKVQDVDKEAYNAYLWAYELWKNPGKLDEAFEYLSLAIQKDPEWAPPYAGLAQVWILRMQYGLVEPGVGMQLIHENINRAIELDPDFRGFYFVSGIISTWTNWNWEQGEKDFLKAIAINPNDVMSRIYYAHLLICLRRPAEALVQGKLAVDLDPLNPMILGLYSGVLRSTGQFQEALEFAEKTQVLGQVKTSAQLKLALMAMGEYDKAWEHRLMAISRSFSEEVVQAIDLIYKEEGYHAADREIVRQFELLAQEKYVPHHILAKRYYTSGAYSKALDELEKGYEVHDPFMPYIAAGQNGYPDLFDSTRFIAILKKMNLPLPVE